MNQLLVMAALFAAGSPAGALRAGEGLGEAGAADRRFGPYEAVAFDPSIVHDVKVEEDGDVSIQLKPERKEKELVVKISDGYFARYREWWHGGYELVSPAGQGKQPYGWTDYVNTAARYIEYRMDGDVFLHLKRRETGR